MTESNSNSKVFKFIIKSTDDKLFNCVNHYVSNLIEDQEKYWVIPLSKDIDIDYEKNNDCSHAFRVNNSYLTRGLSEGTYSFKYNDINVNIEIVRKSEPLGIVDSIGILYHLIIESTEEVIQSIIKESFTAHSNTNKLTIYKFNSDTDRWEQHGKLHKRSLKTIYLDEKKKNKAYNIIKNFLDEKEIKKRRKYAIPHKLNILLSGPPGTGKTSLITSLASEFNLDLNIIPITKNFDDTTILNAFQSIIPKIRKDNRKNIIALEDIDCFLSSENTEQSRAINYSTLLNLLDGIPRIGLDGIIVIMTTNYPNILDHRILRKGRTDIHIEFNYSSKEEIKQVFNRFFPSNLDRFEDFYNKIKNIPTITSVLQYYMYDYLDNIEGLLNKQNINELIEMSNQEIEMHKKSNGIGLSLYC